jgi:hypothetical protein
MDAMMSSFILAARSGSTTIVNCCVTEATMSFTISEETIWTADEEDAERCLFFDVVAAA